MTSGFFMHWGIILFSTVAFSDGTCKSDIRIPSEKICVNTTENTLLYSEQIGATGAKTWQISTYANEMLAW